MPHDRRPVVSTSSSLATAALVLAAATSASAFAPCPTSSALTSSPWPPAWIRAGGTPPPCLLSRSTRHLRGASLALAALSDTPPVHTPPSAPSPARTPYAGAADNSERELAVLTHNPLELRRRLSIAVEEQRFDDAALLKKLLDLRKRSPSQKAARAPRFDVGLVVEHKTLGVRGVIFAADEVR